MEHAQRRCGLPLLMMMGSKCGDIDTIVLSVALFIARELTFTSFICFPSENDISTAASAWDHFMLNSLRDFHMILEVSARSFLV